MKSSKRAIPIVLGMLLLATAAQATVIDFGTPSDPLYNTTDPLIGDVQFSAGDPALNHDTFVDDAMTPGNNYLMSGVSDGHGISLYSGYDAFIGVNRTSSALFGTVSVDIAADVSIPSGTELVLQAFNGATLVGSTMFGASDNGYHTLFLDLGATSGADTLFLTDALNTYNLSDTSFHIDNFTYTDWAQAYPPPNPPPNPAPEPAALYLLGAGLMGMVALRRHG